MNLAKLIRFYNGLKLWYPVWAACHPWLAGLLVTGESAAIGAGTSLVVNGFDVTKHGIQHAVTIVLVTIGVAVRNYIRQSPLSPTCPEIEAHQAVLEAH